MKCDPCEMRTLDGKCTTGCGVVMVAPGNECPYSVETNICPCHSEGITYALARMITEILKKYAKTKDPLSNR